MDQIQDQQIVPLKVGGFSIRELSMLVALMMPTTMALIDVGMVGAISV